MSTFAAIATADIATPDRLRSLDEEAVQQLACSIGEIGLQTAIQVTSAQQEPGSNGPRYRLVAGMHRLAACKFLGLEAIPAVISELTPQQRRMAEIDENLYRRELDALDRGVFVLERQNIYEALHPETKAGVAGGLARQGSATAKIAFAVDAAERTGLSVRTIRYAMNVGAIPCHVRDRIRQSPKLAPLANNQSELLSLAKLVDEDIQEAVLAELEKGECLRVAEAHKKLQGQSRPKGAKDDLDLTKLKRIWVRPHAMPNKTLSTG